MEETAAQVYSLAGAVVVGLISLLAIVALVMQTKERAFGRMSLWIKTDVAVIGFVVMYVIAGIPISWLWAGVFGVTGLGLGYLSGRTSTIRLTESGKLAIKRAIWPFLVSAISYILAAAMVVWGTGGLFSVSLLIVLMGAMMQVGATVSETMQSQPTAPGQSAHPAEA